MVAVVAELAVVNALLWLLSLLSSCYCCGSGGCCGHFVAMVAVVVAVAVAAELAVILRNLDVRIVLGLLSDIIAYCMLFRFIFVGSAIFH